MALTSDFKDAVQNGKVTRVRIMLKDSLLLSSGGDEFQQMLDYAKGHMPELMDEHDGECLKKPDEWDEEYLNEQMVTVVNNFSKERIDLLVNMAKKMYKPQVSRTQLGISKSTYSSSNATNGSSELSSMQKAGMAVATVGAVTVIAGLAIKAPIAITIIGGVAVIAGGAIYLAGRES